MYLHLHSFQFDVIILEVSTFYASWRALPKDILDLFDLLLAACWNWTFEWERMSLSWVCATLCPSHKIVILDLQVQSGTSV